MNHRFIVNGNTVPVWIDKTTPFCTATVWTSQGTHVCDILENDNGKYFIWENTNIYIKNAIGFSLNEIEERIKMGEVIPEEDLSQVIIRNGIENVRKLCKKHPCAFILPEGNIGLDDIKVLQKIAHEIAQNRVRIIDRNKKFPNTGHEGGKQLA